jgi:hypothetical protein
MMDQQLINISILLAGGFGGWMLKIIFEAIGELKKDIKELNREINEDFLRKDDYRVDINDIKAMLNRIFEKLDNKVDK